MLQPTRQQHPNRTIMPGTNLISSNFLGSMYMPRTDVYGHLQFCCHQVRWRPVVGSKNVTASDGHELLAGRTQTSRIQPFLLLATILVLGISTSAAMSDTCISPDQLRAQEIDRTFTQDRYMTGMDNPLQSKGRLQVVKDRISWHMTSPFDVETVITPDSITQSIGGAPPSPIAPAASAIGTPIAKSLASLLRGQWSQLESLFDVSHSATMPGAAWVVSLKPLDPNLQAAMGNIEVKGCTDIAIVEITRSNGDREVIHFDPTGTKTGP